MIKIILIKNKENFLFPIRTENYRTNKMSVANPEQDETVVQNESSNETPDK